MNTDTTPPCANCQRLQAEVDALRAQLAALPAAVAQLQKQLAAARKDSSTSSQPPSSDIVEPPSPSRLPARRNAGPAATIRKFVRDVIGWTISRGQPAEIIAKVSRALERPYEELLGDLPGPPRLNVDATGHQQHGQRQWIWCFRAGLYTLFEIDPTRGADELIDVWGAEFDGVLGCDDCSADRRYHREFGVELPFCLAHPIREVKFLTTRPDARDRAYGERLLTGLRSLFAVIHRREERSAADFQGRLGAAGSRMRRLGTGDVAATRAGGDLAQRFATHGESYFRSLTTPGLEATNNLAEQAIRFVVTDRLITQGTRSRRGNQWCEQIWTVIAGCSQQGRSVFAYLEAAVSAWFEGGEAPSLLPQES